MPFYEYECPSCKFYTELLQKVSDPPLRKCPSCGRKSMKKLVSAPNFRLKGGGWYETDFKSDQEKKRNLAVEKEPESKSAEESAKAKPSDIKPADAKGTETKVTESKAPESKPATSAAASDSGRSTASKRSGRGASGKPATASRKVAAAKSKPRTKATSKRRSR